MDKKCIICGNTINIKRNKLYCSNDCQKEARRIKFISYNKNRNDSDEIRIRKRQLWRKQYHINKYETTFIKFRIKRNHKKEIENYCHNVLEISINKYFENIVYEYLEILRNVKNKKKLSTVYLDKIIMYLMISENLEKSGMMEKSSIFKKKAENIIKFI